MKNFATIQNGRLTQGELGQTKTIDLFGNGLLQHSSKISRKHTIIFIVSTLYFLKKLIAKSSKNICIAIRTPFYILQWTLLIAAILFIVRLHIVHLQNE